VSRPISGILSFGPSRTRTGGHPSMRSTWGLGGPPSHVLTLLRVGFAEPPGSPRALVRSCRTVSPLPVVGPLTTTPIGGLFSVALSCGSPRLAVSQHPALRSPDFPRPGQAWPRPPGQLTVVTSMTHPARSLGRLIGSPVGDVVTRPIPPVDPHPHDAIGRGSRKTSAVRSQPGSGAIDSPWRRSGRLTMSRMAIATTMMTTAITAVPRPPRSRRRRSRSGSDRPLRSQSAFR